MHRRRFLALLLAVGSMPTKALASNGFPTPQPLPPATPRTDEPLQIVTTTTILADLAQQIAGDRASIASIVPANADPHDYEPKPKNIVAVEDADLVITHGLGLDAWMSSLIEDAHPSAPIVVATDGIETLHSESFEGGDPHVWFDPIRTRQMTANITAALKAIDPEGADSYQARLESYSQSMEALDAAIRETTQTLTPEQRVLVTNHDALEYFAERYDFRVVGTVLPGNDTNTEASAKEIAELLDLVEQYNVPAIFSENTVDPNLALALAEEAGVKMVAELFTDSLGKPDSGADSYLGLMETDTRVIVANLSGSPS